MKWSLGLAFGLTIGWVSANGNLDNKGPPINKCDNSSNKCNGTVATLSKEENLKDIGLGRIYLINLDKRVDRLEATRAIFDYFNLPLTRFPAIKGTKLREVLEKNGTSKDVGINPLSRMDMQDLRKRMLAGSEMYYNRVACWQSHLGVYFDIVARARETKEDKPVMIVEDDNVYDENAFDVIKKTMTDLPNDWEVLFAGYCFGMCGKYQEGAKHKLMTCKSPRSYCANAYIVRNSTVAARLASFSNSQFEQIADLTWIPHQTRGVINFYLIRPKPIVHQDRSSFGSDLVVGLDVDKAMFKQAPGYWPAFQAALRKYKLPETKTATRTTAAVTTTKANNAVNVLKTPMVDPPTNANVVVVTQIVYA